MDRRPFFPLASFPSLFLVALMVSALPVDATHPSFVLTEVFEPSVTLVRDVTFTHTFAVPEETRNLRVRVAQVAPQEDDYWLAHCERRCDVSSAPPEGGFRVVVTEPGLAPRQTSSGWFTKDPEAGMYRVEIVSRDGYRGPVALIAVGQTPAQTSWSGLIDLFPVLLVPLTLAGVTAGWVWSRRSRPAVPAASTSAERPDGASSSGAAPPEGQETNRRAWSVRDRRAGASGIRGATVPQALPSIQQEDDPEAEGPADGEERTDERAE